MVFNNQTKYGLEQTIIVGGTVDGAISDEIFIYTIPELVPIPETTWISCSRQQIFVDRTG